MEIHRPSDNFELDRVEEPMSRRQQRRFVRRVRNLLPPLQPTNLLGPETSDRSYTLPMAKARYRLGSEIVRLRETDMGGILRSVRVVRETRNVNQATGLLEVSHKAYEMRLVSDGKVSSGEYSEHTNVYDSASGQRIPTLLEEELEQEDLEPQEREYYHDTYITQPFELERSTGMGDFTQRHYREVMKVLVQLGSHNLVSEQEGGRPLAL